MSNEVRKYWVKAAFKTNLDSMATHVKCCMYDIEDGKCETVNLMGKEMTYSDLVDFEIECQELLGYAMYGKVTGSEYGRIKAISDERNMLRYSQCIAKGMDEEKAAYAFME